MRVSLKPGEIRELVIRTFDEFGADADALADMSETILFDGRKYRGRSYRTDTFLAVWLIEVGLVQFYDARGNMLRTVNLFEEWQPQAMAA